MGFFDSIKNIMSIPEEDDYDEEIEDVEEEKPAERRKPVQHSRRQHLSAVSPHRV